MITKPADTNSDGHGGEAPPKTKLNLRQRKQLLLEWFLDDDESGIGTFCVDVKGVPHARRFLQNAARELDLISLRKQRKEGGEAVDEVAASRISQFRPKRNGERKPDAEGGCHGGPKEPKAKMGKQEMKALVTDWFNEEDMKSVHRFLKQRDALKMRARMLRVINQNGLRKLRKKRDDSEATKLAVAKIEKLGTGDGSNDPMSTDVKEKGRRQNHRSARVVALARQDGAMKPMLVAWFNDENMQPIPRFLKQKNALEKKDGMVRMVKEIHLRKLRKTRSEPGVHKLAMSKIDALFASVPASTEVVTSDAESEASCPRRGTSSTGKSMESALLEWFDDEKMSSIRHVFKQRSYVEMTGSVMKSIQESGLRKLRTDRVNPEVRALALKKIDSLANQTPVISHENGAGPNRRRGNKNAGGGRIDKAAMESLLLEWFFDKDTPSITDFLKQKEAPEAKPVMVRIVKEGGLRKLRKRCDDPEVRSAAEPTVRSLCVEAAPREKKVHAEKPGVNKKLSQEKPPRKKQENASNEKKEEDGSKKSRRMSRTQNINGSSGENYERRW